MEGAKSDERGQKRDKKKTPISRLDDRKRKGENRAILLSLSFIGYFIFIAFFFSFLAFPPQLSPRVFNFPHPKVQTPPPLLAIKFTAVAVLPSRTGQVAWRKKRERRQVK